ncbi:TolC family protein [candidate division FCPU426 bacterium]|nr:TolC family protein [candidate division FCPU426 bacterium]
MKKKKCAAVGAMMLLLTVPAQGGDVTNAVDLDHFVRTACRMDKTFEAILLEEAVAQYRAKLNLPAHELLLSLKGRYGFSLREDESGGPEGSIGLSKLFPASGTALEVEYGLSSSNVLNQSYSTFTLAVSQPIARNAFGHANRLLAQISGLEIELASHQMIEAYEDYLARVMQVYYSWYSAYAHWQAEKTTHREYLRLLANVQARRQSRIADQTDVNKVRVQVLEREANLLSLEQACREEENRVKQIMGMAPSETLVPAEPALYQEDKVDFAEAFAHFTEKSRTEKIIKILESKAGKELDRQADALLPSANLLLGYAAEGTDEVFDSRKNEVFAGVEIDMPFFNDHGQWRRDMSEKLLKQEKASAASKRLQLRTELENLLHARQKTVERRDLAEQKMKVSEDILRDENRYYLQGRAELNDLILAANNLEQARYLHIQLSVQCNVLLLEWLRLTDQLVSAQDLEKTKTEPGEGN